MRLLEENDYLIKIEKCHKGIQMFLPERRISPHSIKTVKKYIVSKNQLFSNDHTGETRNILRPVNVPTYAIQCTVYLDILQHCRMFNYAAQCVKVGERYGLEHVFSMLPAMDEVNETKSGNLFKALFEKVDARVLEEQEILDGYIRPRPYLESI